MFQKKNAAAAALLQDPSSRLQVVQGAVPKPIYSSSSSRQRRQSKKIAIHILRCPRCPKRGGIAAKIRNVAGRVRACSSIISQRLQQRLEQRLLEAALLFAAAPACCNACLQKLACCAAAFARSDLCLQQRLLTTVLACRSAYISSTAKPTTHLLAAVYYMPY